MWDPEAMRLRYMEAFERPEAVWERAARAGARSLVVDPYQLWPPTTTLVITGYCAEGVDGHPQS